MTEQNPPLVPAGADRFGERRGLGFGAIAFKVVPADSAGILILENVVHARGGPGRHLHVSQDEWFCAQAGEFVVEVAGQRHVLRPGDALLAPRQVPHTWALTSAGVGRLLLVFNPAGQMEAFFREVTKVDAPPPLDPALWRAHGMELLGPPLDLT